MARDIRAGIASKFTESQWSWVGRVWGQDGFRVGILNRPCTSRLCFPLRYSCLHLPPRLETSTPPVLVNLQTGSLGRRLRSEGACVLAI